MRTSLYFAALGAFCSSLASASPLALPRRGSGPTVRTVAQFPDPTWLENLSFRSNGNILATQAYPDAVLWEINPKGYSAPVAAATFPSSLMLTGIAEARPDVFVVASGNSSFNPAPPVNSGAGTWGVYVVDMHTKPPTASSKILIREAGLLNGMTTLCENTVLIADSLFGVVYSVNIKTKEVRTVISDPTMLPALPGPSGINGVHISKGYLYFDNSGTFKLFRVPINSDGTAAGPVEELADIGITDDFILDREDSSKVYVAHIIDDNVAVVDIKTDSSRVIAGSEYGTLLAGPTALQWGVGPANPNTLYVTTTGGIFYQNVTVGGAVKAIDFY